MIFGASRAKSPVDQFSAMLPGIIGGYGGGTFDMQGRQVTPRMSGLLPVMDQSGGLLAPRSNVQMGEARNPGDAVPRPSIPAAQGGDAQPDMPIPSVSGPASIPQQRGIFGSSIRKPFDYDAVRSALIPPEQQHSKTHNTIMKILEIAAPTLMALGGNDAGANAFVQDMQRRREDASKRRFEVDKTLAQWQHEDWARQNGADLGAAAPFTIGRNRLTYNSATGQVEPIYHGSADFEDYAAAKGLEPGTPAYFKAVEDYVLRGNGPTALGYDKSLDDYRTGNRLKIEGVRQSNRIGLEGVKQGNRVNLRGVPTFRDTHGGAGRAAMPTVNTPEEAMKLPAGTQFRTPDGQVRVRP